MYKIIPLDEKISDIRRLYRFYKNDGFNVLMASDGFYDSLLIGLLYLSSSGHNSSSIYTKVTPIEKT